MSSPTKETEEASSSNAASGNAAEDAGEANTAEQRPPAKRPIASTVIEISDTDSDDSDVCAVNSYQASADEVKRIRRGQCRVLLRCLSWVRVIVLRGNTSHFKINAQFKLKHTFTQRI